MLRQARSALAFLLVLLWFVPGSIILRLVFWPAVYLFPARRQRLVALYMKMMSGGILGVMRLGGARTERPHRVSTAEPALLIMNHQSLLDVPTLVLMSHPYAPHFVTRTRYARFVPAVSLTLRLLDCPLIDPHDRRGALRALKAAAMKPHCLLIFPEGHRTRDGALQPFRTAGVEAILRTRALPVFLVVTDGFWACRRLVDFVFNVHRIQGRTEVLGPFPSPGPDEVPAFLADMHTRMEQHLARMRSASHGG